MKKVKFLILMTLIIASSACNLIKTNDQKDAGDIQSETRNLSGFREIEAMGALDLEISVGKDFSVSVETNKDLLESVKTEIKGETLEISTKGKISLNDKVRIKISMPELKNLDLTGTSNAAITNVKGESLKIQASGASTITVDGETTSLEAIANGASRIDAENLKTEKAKASAAGSSNITVSPTDSLEAEAMGASNILYTNDVKNIKQNAVGVSSIKKK